MKKRILVVDDEAGVLKVTKFRLEHEGYEVLVAYDGQDAVDRANTDLPIHLILLDLRMPKLNGYEVCQALKRQSKTSEIPVIIFSASDQVLQRLADRCIELGASDWIKKPFHTAELMAKIHRALGEDAG